MIDFTPFVARAKSKLNKDQLKAFSDIVSFDALRLASLGQNDIEGYQVFTPLFIVKGMCEAIGKDLYDSAKTVLEPTSGDGAFTTYILKKRLERIRDDFEIESLRALSTIYSIEMDKDLIQKQRNNIFTLVNLFITENSIPVDKSYFEILKCMIITNFIWGMFNSIHDNGGGLAGVDVAYKMPDAEKGKITPLGFPVWQISKDEINFHEEGVEIW